MNFECPTPKFFPSLFDIGHSVFDIKLILTALT